jgi:hypothetical protein
VHEGEGAAAAGTARVLPGGIRRRRHRGGWCYEDPAGDRGEGTPVAHGEAT